MMPAIKTGVRIPSADQFLDGDLILPEQATGLVLFAHGSGSSRHSPRNQFVAQTMQKSGVGTLLFDLLTGAEEEIDSITRHLRFDIQLLANRLIDATRWATSQIRGRPIGIGYFGASTGGGAALVAAAELGGQIGAVVSRGGRPDLAGNALPLVMAPTLLIVGERDKAVIELNEQAFRRLTCEKELKVVKGASHLFEEAGTLEEGARLATSWFTRHLRAG